MTTARPIVGYLYEICICTAPMSLVFFLWAGTTEFGSGKPYLASLVMAGAWIYLAIIAAITCRNLRKRLILLALSPVACGLQVYFGLVTLAVKLGRFAP